jgi:serine/threonine protein kinase
MDSTFFNDKFLGQGTYGCVYKTKLKCTNKRNKKLKNINNNELSKIYINEKHASKELEISKYITKIPHYDRYFSPLLDSCAASLAQLNQNDIDKCDLINDKNQQEQQSKPYFTTITKYIRGKTLNEYLEEHQKTTTKDKFENKVFYIYTCLKHSIEILNANGIVHFDLSERNIIMDTSDRPIIIDYGMSINTRKVTTPEQYNYEFAHYSFMKDNNVDFYEPWCIEIIILMYLNQTVSPDDVINATHIEEMIRLSDQYSEHVNRTLNTPSPSTRQHSLFESFIAKSAFECSQELMKTYPKWDLYAISLMCFKYLPTVATTPRKQEILDEIKSAILV